MPSEDQQYSTASYTSLVRGYFVISILLSLLLRHVRPMSRDTEHVVDLIYCVEDSRPPVYLVRHKSRSSSFLDESDGDSEEDIIDWSKVDMKKHFPVAKRKLDFPGGKGPSKGKERASCTNFYSSASKPGTNKSSKDSAGKENSSRSCNR